LLVTEMGKELVLYDLQAFKAHRLNPTSAFVYKACDGNRSVAEIAQLLSNAHSGTTNEQVVWYALKRLQGASLLETRLEFPQEAKGITRRELMKTLGVAAAVALPVITSIVVPTPAQAQSCLPSGSTCSPPGTNPACCSGQCIPASGDAPGRCA
jgi:hypothetical protein